MHFLIRLVRSTLAWIHPEPGENWNHRITWAATTIVSFPFLVAVGTLMLIGSVAFAGFSPEVYGTRRVVIAFWVLAWVILFFPVDRITERHLAGDEPAESQWLIVKFTASAIAVFVLTVLIVTY